MFSKFIFTSPNTAEYLTFKQSFMFFFQLQKSVHKVIFYKVDEA